MKNALFKSEIIKSEISMQQIIKHIYCFVHTKDPFVDF